MLTAQWSPDLSAWDLRSVLSYLQKRMTEKWVRHSRVSSEAQGRIETDITELVNSCFQYLLDSYSALIPGVKGTIEYRRNNF